MQLQVFMVFLIFVFLTSSTDFQKLGDIKKPINVLQNMKIKTTD